MNLSYRRFENTLSALRDCAQALRDDAGPLSATELDAAKALLALCGELCAELHAGDLPDELY